MGDECIARDWEGRFSGGNKGVGRLTSLTHEGGSIAFTDAAKASVWQATWQPWGAPQQITGSLVLNQRFPGQWFQLESGLHYNWHRHYDPSLGRYTQPDPLGFVDGPSVYGYAGGNPHAYVDPDGRFFFVAFYGFSAATALADLAVAGGATWWWQQQMAAASDGGSSSASSASGASSSSAANMCPPGDCTPDQHRRLQEMVDNACGSAKKCTGFDIGNPGALNKKIGNHSRCIDARRRINNTCFRGGDDGHKRQIDERINAIRWCQDLMAR